LELAGISGLARTPSAKGCSRNGLRELYRLRRGEGEGLVAKIVTEALEEMQTETGLFIFVTEDDIPEQVSHPKEFVVMESRRRKVGLTI
jgi:hypothetical protein